MVLVFPLAGKGDWFKFTFVFSGMHKMTPPIKDLLPRLTPILKNRHEKVQENCIDLVGRIADRWVDECFVLSKSGWVQRASPICVCLSGVLSMCQQGSGWGFVLSCWNCWKLTKKPSAELRSTRLVISPKPLGKSAALSFYLVKYFLNNSF